MDQPTLCVFAISHYCEKARWALDACGIGHEVRHLMPGAHTEVAKACGAAGSSLPLLLAGDEVVQGSDAIFDWADAHAQSPTMRLALETGAEAEGRALEADLDAGLGVHVRRYYYSEALLEHPATVLPLFADPLAPAERETLTEHWAVVCELISGAYDLGAPQQLESKEVIEEALDALDERLRDGRRYLIGERFSRVDVTAASLLAALALPDGHPTYGSLVLPPRVRADVSFWSERPSLRWVHDIYARHRGRTQSLRPD